MSNSTVKPLNEQQKQLILEMLDKRSEFACEAVDAENWRIVELQAEIAELEQAIVAHLKRGINNGSMAIVATTQLQDNSK